MNVPSRVFRIFKATRACVSGFSGWPITPGKFIPAVSGGCVGASASCTILRSKVFSSFSAISLESLLQGFAFLILELTCLC